MTCRRIDNPHWCAKHYADLRRRGLLLIAAVILLAGYVAVFRILFAAVNP